MKFLTKNKQTAFACIKFYYYIIFQEPIAIWRLTDKTGAPAGLTHEQWNLATVFIFHYWSDSTENKMKFLHEAGVFHKHREEQEPPDEEEEVTSYSSEEDSDAKEECRLTLLHHLTGDPRSTRKSQALAMPPPLRKEVVNQETKRDESTAVARNLDLQFLMIYRVVVEEKMNILFKITEVY